MQTIQLVLDKELLQAADRAARQSKQNRSALIRDALRAHLRRMETARKVARERAGYKRIPDDAEAAAAWAAVAVWPAE